MMEEHLWRVYRYYNPIENKSYVGQTTRNVNDRAKKGKGYRKGTKFREAIDKYGWENFEQSILRLCTSQKDASYWEKYFIDKFDCIDNGYNSSCGGEVSGTLDTHLSESCKKRLSESKKGKPKSEETRRSISESKKGHEVTEETRKKISESLKGQYVGKSSPFYGKHHTEESRRKMSDNHYDCSGGNNPAYGRTWWNNGTINIYININTTEVPEGFVKGKLQKRNSET